MNLRAPARAADMQRCCAAETEWVGVVRDAGAVRGERLARVEAESGGQESCLFASNLQCNSRGQ